MQKTNSLKFLYFIFLTLLTPLQARVTWDSLPVKDKIKKHLLSGEFSISSQLENVGKGKKQQVLVYSIIGLHPSSCEMALPRLSLYENYENYLGFIQKSEYDKESQLIQLTLGHTILPFTMGLNFKLPRLTQPEVYQFSFAQGFLKNLKGEIHVSKGHDGRCLFYTTAKWRGPHTGISPGVFTFFSTTLSRMAMDGLFRATRAL